ncbi:MAG TPA: LuxR C-terminal-related transcriptional regulator [Ktedonosporobacter sp.]|nr:LuxR C-terminal-related transcriptional regulator [Ktedonosporobacter sp.]
MPKAATHALIWSEDKCRYEWHCQGDTTRPIYIEDEQQSIQPVDGSSFAFQGKWGRLTLRKEARSHGEGYWYAYRNLGRKTLKKYLGRTDDLTIARLEEIAEALNARADSPTNERAYVQKARSPQSLEAGASSPPGNAAPSGGIGSSSPALPPLLVPKLRLPRLHASLVHREQLLARLDAGLERKLTLLSAPAGFGKTTLVSQWATQYTLRQQQPAVAWVALDDGDNDPVRFWSYVIKACQGVQDTIGQSALALLHTAQRSPFAPLPLEAALTMFLNDLSQLAQRVILVLEDYHVITSAEIHEALAFILEHLPMTFHLIMLTRVDPPLSLTRLRAHDELNELHAADLRFSQEETQTFLQRTLPFPLTPEVITQLDTTTEGWVTGLRLMTFALQGRATEPQVERFLADLSGNSRHILEYFVTEVLEAQSGPLQLFLLRTSVLNRLTSSLCDAVTGRNDSEELLEALARANLFLQPLDGVGEWYRYHPLFAEAMQHEAGRRLGGDALLAGYARASFWYEQHALLADAVEAALEARSFERAADLMEPITDLQRFHETREHHTIRRWLELLPKEVLIQHPRLCLDLAVVLLPLASAQGWTAASVAQVEKPLHIAEELFQAGDNLSGLGEVLAIRSVLIRMQGDLGLAYQLSRQALVWLPESAKQWRATALMFAGEEALLAGETLVARPMFLEAHTLVASIRNQYATRAVLLKLGEICLLQGELHQGAEVYREVLAIAGDDLSDRGAALLGLSRFSYEWNDLATAEQQAQEAHDLAKRLSDETLQIQSSLILACIQQARGQTEAALQTLYALLARLHVTPRTTLLYREVLLWQARLQLAMGDLVSVERWRQVSTTAQEAVPPLQQEQEDLMFARLLIAQGKMQEAQPLLEHWQAEANQQGRTSRELVAKILIAIGSLLQQRQPQAASLLREVLIRAHTEGYLRLFLDEGKALISLLRGVLPTIRKELPAAYVRTLLHAITEAHPEQDAAHSPVLASLIEPLSPQEERVLHLLADGLTNPEIAEELIVSVNTVKTQVQSIYRKLNVTSRKEAREAVRSRHML